MSDLKAKMHQNHLCWSSVPDLAGRAYSTPPDCLAGLKEPNSKWRRREERGYIASKKF